MLVTTVSKQLILKRLQKPVVVVLGGTGYGKTTIFDAINWSLYGGEYEQSLVKRRQRKIEDYVNQKALGLMKKTNHQK